MMYVDNEVMLQGAKKQLFATRCLQEQLDHQLSWTLVLGIQYTTAKSKLIYLQTSNGSHDSTDAMPIKLYNGITELRKHQENMNYPQVEADLHGLHGHLFLLKIAEIS